MSVRNAIVLLFALSAIAFLAACGGGGHSVTKAVPPPTGGFSNANLNGTYVFSVSGTDANNAPYAIVGTFTANGAGGNGKGGITGGAIDVNDLAFSGLVANAPIISSSSSYSIGVDGRGNATLGTGSAIPWGNNIVFDFVLQDSSHGLITQFDGNATGSGSFDLQAAGATPTGSYAFSFSGADATNGNPFATVGNFTFTSGSAISGLEDFNDGGFAYTDQPLTGTVVLGPSSTPATSLITTQYASPGQTYDVFAIDASHLKFIEMDSFGTLSGDAFSQSSPAAVPTGTLAFTLAGFFPSTSSPSAYGGFMVTDGSGNITTASTEDANQGGTVSAQPVTFSATYTAAGSGRYTLSTPPPFAGGTEYVAYPSTGGLLLLEIDSTGGIMLGAAYTQTGGSTFAASEGYGLNLTGINLNGTGGGTGPVEVDDIAEFTAASSGTTISGVIDENFEPSGGTNYGLALSGSYTAPDSNGRGSISATAGNNSTSTLNGGFGLTFYTVDGTTFPFIETDSGGGQIATGVIVKQNPSASGAAVAKSHSIFVARPLIRPHDAHRQQR